MTDADIPPDPAPAGSGPAPAVKPMSCPACGGTIEIRAAGYTVNLACQYCGTLLDVSNPDIEIIERYEQKVRTLEIPLGKRGTLKGVEWEAIGYLSRSEGGAYPWDEYLLFNPYHGYRWLVTNGRGWTLGTMLTSEPDYSGGTMMVDGQPYAPFFAGGTAQVDYVLGEFYWRVKRGEEANTADYVRPRFMLSFEGSEDERNWTLGELLDGKEIAQSFGVDPPPAWRPGGPPPLPHQPSPYARSAGMIGKIALVAAGALLLLMTVFGMSSRKQSYDVPLRTDAGAVSATIGPVTLTRTFQPVTISARAPALENAWVDLDYELVNRKTQESFSAYAAAERYSGRDSDGDWTEGSRSATVKMAMVPAGDYDLVVEASGTKWGYAGNSDSVLVTIDVAQGGRFWSNFFLALILLLIPAIWAIWRHVGFESARLAESDQGSPLADMFEEDDDE